MLGISLVLVYVMLNFSQVRSIGMQGRVVVIVGVGVVSLVLVYVMLNFSQVRSIEMQGKVKEEKIKYNHNHNIYVMLNFSQVRAIEIQGKGEKNILTITMTSYAQL